MNLNSLLPPEIAEGASLRDNEYGWPVSAFTESLTSARSRGFACLGGQFQFRFPSTIYEMYWLEANATARLDGEPWSNYSSRSCSEVMSKFEELISKTDFAKEAANFGLDRHAVDTLVFVAYFESESSFAELSSMRRL